MSSNVPPTPPQAAPAPPPSAQPAKKTSPWVWVAAGCGGLLVVSLVVVLVVAFFVRGKVKDFAKDAEANPALAAARMVVRLNPELEEVSSDVKQGTITIRNRKTGEVVTFDASEVEQGRISFTGDKEGESFKVEFGGEGERGRLRVESSEGTMEWGTGDGQEIPRWVPTYPGVTPQGVFSSRTGDEASGAYTFNTADGVDAVLSRFQRELEGAGFEVSTSTFQQGGRMAGGTLSASSADDRRSVHLMMGVDDDRKTQVTVTYTERR
jgi:hypothetical protein